jgi:hypothetical protein
VAGLLVGDGDQPVGGVPGVGVYAVVEQVAIGIVAIGGTACGDYLVQCIDGQGDAVFADGDVGQIAGGIVLVAFCMATRVRCLAAVFCSNQAQGVVVLVLDVIFPYAVCNYFSSQVNTASCSTFSRTGLPSKSVTVAFSSGSSLSNHSRLHAISSISSNNHSSLVS